MNDKNTQIFFKDNCVGPVTIKRGHCEEKPFKKSDVIEIAFSDGDTMKVKVINAIYHDDQSVELTLERVEPEIMSKEEINAWTNGPWECVCGAVIDGAWVCHECGRGVIGSNMERSRRQRRKEET